VGRVNDGRDAGEAEDARSASQVMRAAAVVVGLEALALIAIGVSEAFHIDADRVGLGITNVVFFLLYGGLLLLCARGLLGARSWSRSPIVLTQLIQLGVAWSFVGGETTWVAILLAVPALGVLGVMLAPSTTDVLYGRRSQWDVEEPADRD
jgi:peptidoglycan/LPS O-acetylase OafA/YrhL